MTMNPIEVERKVRQLDGDVQAIYEMISGIQGTQRRHTNRLNELTAKLDSVEAKVDKLEAKVDVLASKVDTHDARFDALDGKLDMVLTLLRDR